MCPLFSKQVFHLNLPGGVRREEGRVLNLSQTLQLGVCVCVCVCVQFRKRRLNACQRTTSKVTPHPLSIHFSFKVESLIGLDLLQVGEASCQQALGILLPPLHQCRDCKHLPTGPTVYVSTGAQTQGPCAQCSPDGAWYEDHLPTQAYGSLGFICQTISP